MFGLSKHRLPRIRSYKDLERQFTVYPIKGDDNRSYLSRKGDSSKLIVRYGDKYSVCYHGTNLITYMPDGSVEIDPGVHSQSDRILFDVCLPSGIEVWNVRGYTTFKLNGKFQFEAASKFTVARKDDLWQFVKEPEYCTYYTYKADRKVMARARQIVGDVIVYRKLKGEKEQSNRASKNAMVERVLAYDRGETSLAVLSHNLYLTKNTVRHVTAILGGLTREPIPLGEALPWRKNPWEESYSYVQA